jgi:Flp pilus assembly protein TadD
MKSVATTLLNEGTEYLLLGQMEEAESRFRGSLVLNETSPVVHNNLGFLLMQQERYDDASQQYLRAMQLDPGYATAYTNMGINCLMTQRWEEAKEYLLQALALDEDDFHANECLAQLLMPNHPAESEYYWRKAYVLRPQSGILINLAQTILEQQRTDEALEMLQLIDSDQAGNARYHALLGNIHFVKYDFGAAIKSFRQALGIEPESTEVRHNLGMAFLATGQSNEALLEFKRILLLHPGYIEARNNLAVLELASGNGKAAMDHFIAVLAQDPVNAKALYYKALIHVQVQQTSEAKEIIAQVVATEDKEYAPKARLLLAAIG